MSANGATYEDALAAARALISEDCKAIVIRSNAGDRLGLFPLVPPSLGRWPPRGRITMVAPVEDQAVENEKTTPKKVFVISPIGPADGDIRKNADRFLDYIVRPALPAPEYNVFRADEDDSPDAITEAMLRAILESEICVVDITGLNANVMYELALAHAAGQRVVIMTRDEGSRPFDIKDMRAIQYGFMPEQIEAAIKQLRKKATHEHSSPEWREMISPVATAFRKMMDLNKIEAESGTSADAITRVVENLERKVDRLLINQNLQRHASVDPQASTLGGRARPVAPRSIVLMRATKLLAELNRLREIPDAPSSTEERFQEGADLFLQTETEDLDPALLDRWYRETRGFVRVHEGLL